MFIMTQMLTYDLDSNRLKESLILLQLLEKVVRLPLPSGGQKICGGTAGRNSRILAHLQRCRFEAKPVFYAVLLSIGCGKCSSRLDIKGDSGGKQKGYELRYYLPQDWMTDASYPRCP